MSTAATTTAVEAKEVLRVDELRKEFPGHRIRGTRTRSTVQAVNGVSLSLREGKTLGIVGETGCGKSTTARMIMGLIEPTDGTISVNGRNVTHMTQAERTTLHRNVQMVFQDPYASLDPRMTVRRLVREPLDVNRVGSHAERDARVNELLALVGLSAEHAARYPHQFSGGQRQRISIARALALDPRILVLDEPVSALDVSLQAQVIALLRSLQEQIGIAYLFISHDLSVVRHLCDDVAVMYLGRIVEQGPVEQVFAHPRHPYTRALLSSVPIPDPELRGQRERIILAGDVPSPASIPTGCAFRGRCALATEDCAADVPALAHRGDAATGTEDHLVACIHTNDRIALPGAQLA